MNRSQRVKVDDHYSAPEYTTLLQPNGGIPQGTVTDPVNFLLQINDLATPCPIVKYVDDGTMYEVCTIGSTSNIQESLDITIKWSEENDMCINSDKSKEMLICFVRTKDIKNLCPTCMKTAILLKGCQPRKYSVLLYPIR